MAGRQARLRGERRRLRSRMFCAHNRSHRAFDRRLDFFRGEASGIIAAQDRWYLPKIRHEKFGGARVLHRQNFRPSLFFRRAINRLFIAQVR